jgi:signal transduction histidine kinase
MIATAIIMAIVFGAIYYSVQQTVMRNVDSDLSYEAKKHSGEIKLIGDSILFINKAEWQEREHREIQVNPVFIQLVDKEGKVMDKSPNLKEENLPFNESASSGHFNTSLNSRLVRQVQIPVRLRGEVKGYIQAAISLEAAQSVILKLRNVLLISYLSLLLGLYFISRFLAGRSILPVQEVSRTLTRITKQNLKERVTLPPHKDEIYDLSANFNALLDRIERAIEREKQFTSDASHELRTPLATLRGTLEVLIRKARTQEEYEEKIRFSLQEIERMTETIEQLLLLARLESKVEPGEENKISVSRIIDDSLSRFRQQILEKSLRVEFNFDEGKKLLVPNYYTSLIIDNLLSNAIKYSPDEAGIYINVEERKEGVLCSIKDEGIGIKEEDLSQVYQSFFRSEALNHKQIKGNGLGLSIVKKCIDAIQAEITFDSKPGKGTIVQVSFKQS